MTAPTHVGRSRAAARGVVWLPVLCLGLVLVGCESPPPERERALTLELPDAWQAAELADAPADAEWWLRFGDGRLSELVRLALAANPDLTAVAARLAEARAQATLAGAELRPDLSAGLAVSRTKRNLIGLPFPGGDLVTSRFSSYELSLASSWELNLWGRLRAGEGAALARADAALADLLGARLSLIGATLRAGFALIEARQQEDLAERQVRNWEEHAALVERRYRSGLGDALAARRVATELAGARERLTARRQASEEAARSLAVLLGRAPDASLGAGDALPALPAPVPGGLPASLLSRRPDLVAAERRLAAAELDVQVARADFYPRLSLTASVGTSSDALGDLLDGDYAVWSLAANLVQPIFEGGRLRAQVELQDARADGALAAFAGTLLDALAEVESALAAERWLALREEDTAAAARDAIAARDLAQERYASGLTDLLTLLDAQRAAQGAEVSLLAIRRARLDARVALHLALGGGFDAAREVPPSGEVAPDTRDTDTPPPVGASRAASMSEDSADPDTAPGATQEHEPC